MNIRTEYWNNHAIRFVEVAPNDWWAIAKACGYSNIDELLDDKECIIDRLNTPTSSFILTSTGQILYETDFYNDDNTVFLPGVAARLCEYMRLMPATFINTVNKFIEKTCNDRVLWFMSKADPCDCGELLKRLSIISGYDNWLLMNQEPKKTHEEIRNQNQLKPVVYFIKAENGLVKIGCTANLDLRFRALSSMSPCKLTLLHKIDTDKQYAEEKRFHDQFSNKRSHGEWFQLDKTDIERIMVR